MALSALIGPDSVFVGLKGNSKKQVLQELAGPIARVCGAAEREVFDTLLQRERLGTTGIGKGIAVPHGRIRGLSRLHGFFLRLARPVDFDAPDSQPVDLLFVLLAPDGAGADHLRALARVARLLRAPGFADGLRQTEDVAALHALLTRAEDSRAA